MAANMDTPVLIILAPATVIVRCKYIQCAEYNACLHYTLFGLHTYRKILVLKIMKIFIYVFFNYIAFIWHCIKCNNKKQTFQFRRDMYCKCCKIFGYIIVLFYTFICFYTGMNFVCISYLFFRIYCFNKISDTHNFLIIN